MQVRDPDTEVAHARQQEHKVDRNPSPLPHAHDQQGGEFGRRVRRLSATTESRARALTLSPPLPPLTPQDDWELIFHLNHLNIRLHTKIIKLHRDTTNFLVGWNPATGLAWRQLMLPFALDPWSVDTLLLVGQLGLASDLLLHFRPKALELDLEEPTTFETAWSIVNALCRIPAVTPSKIVVRNIVRNGPSNRLVSSHAEYPDGYVAERVIVLRVRDGESADAVKAGLLAWLGPEDEEQDQLAPSYDWGAHMLRSATVLR